MRVEVGGVELHQAHSQGEEGGAVSLRLPAVVQRLQQEHPHLHQASLQEPSIFIKYPLTRATPIPKNRFAGLDPNPHGSALFLEVGSGPAIE
jgi:hypothetical protein